MDVIKRQKLCRMVEKVETNKAYANKLGTKNKSKYQRKRKQEV